MDFFAIGNYNYMQQRSATKTIYYNRHNSTMKQQEFQIEYETHEMRERNFAYSF